VTGLTGKVNFTAAFDNVEREHPDGAKWGFAQKVDEMDIPRLSNV